MKKKLFFLFFSSLLGENFLNAMKRQEKLELKKEKIQPLRKEDLIHCSNTQDDLDILALSQDSFDFQFCSLSQEESKRKFPIDSLLYKLQQEKKEEQKKSNKDSLKSPQKDDVEEEGFDHIDENEQSIQSFYNKKNIIESNQRDKEFKMFFQKVLYNDTHYEDFFGECLQNQQPNFSKKKCLIPSISLKSLKISHEKKFNENLKKYKNNEIFLTNLFLLNKETKKSLLEFCENCDNPEVYHLFFGGPHNDTLVSIKSKIIFFFQNCEQDEYSGKAFYIKKYAEHICKKESLKSLFTKEKPYLQEEGKKNDKKENKYFTQCHLLHGQKLYNDYQVFSQVLSLLDEDFSQQNDSCDYFQSFEHLSSSLEKRDYYLEEYKKTKILLERYDCLLEKIAHGKNNFDDKEPQKKILIVKKEYKSLMVKFDMLFLKKNFLEKIFSFFWPEYKTIKDLKRNNKDAIRKIKEELRKISKGQQQDLFSTLKDLKKNTHILNLFNFFYISDKDFFKKEISTHQITQLLSLQQADSQNPMGQESHSIIEKINKIMEMIQKETTLKKLINVDQSVGYTKNIFFESINNPNIFFEEKKNIPISYEVLKGSFEILKDKLHDGEDRDISAKVIENFNEEILSSLIFDKKVYIDSLTKIRAEIPHIVKIAQEKKLSFYETLLLIEQENYDTKVFFSNKYPFNVSYFVLENKVEEQFGWNCFDIAMNLEKILPMSKEQKNKINELNNKLEECSLFQLTYEKKEILFKKSILIRQFFVDFLLTNSNIKKYREFLYWEIFSHLNEYIYSENGGSDDQKIKKIIDTQSDAGKELKDQMFEEKKLTEELDIEKNNYSSLKEYFNNLQEDNPDFKEKANELMERAKKIESLEQKIQEINNNCLNIICKKDIYEYFVKNYYGVFDSRGGGFIGYSGYDNKSVMDILADILPIEIRIYTKNTERSGELLLVNSISYNPQIIVNIYHEGLHFIPLRDMFNYLLPRR